MAAGAKKRVEKSLTKAQEEWGRLGQVLWDGHKPGRLGGDRVGGWFLGSPLGWRKHTLTLCHAEQTAEPPLSAHRLTASKQRHATADGCRLRLSARRGCVQVKVVESTELRKSKL